jgi:hypothetical protein
MIFNYLTSTRSKLDKVNITLKQLFVLERVGRTQPLILSILYILNACSFQYLMPDILLRKLMKKCITLFLVPCRH